MAQSERLFDSLPQNADLLPSQEQLIDRIRNQKTTKDVRAITINRSAFFADRLTFNLSGDRSFSAERFSLEKADGGDDPQPGDEFSWIGQIAGGLPDDSVMYVDKDGLVSGTFSTRDGDFEIRPVGGDVHVVIEIDPNAFPPEHPGAPPVAPDDRTDNSQGIQPDAIATNIVDIFIAYTPAAASNYFSISGHANKAVNTANNVYQKTGLNTRLRLVGVEVLDYQESSSMNIDLNRLRLTNDGHMDNIHALRNDKKADLVHLIVSRSDYCGLAYVKASRSYAFGITDHSCVGSNKSFTHEVGHNFGGCHDPNNSGSCPYSYGHGYQDPGGAFRTVMAYACPNGGCPRRAIHSHPQQYGQAQKHDVKRVIANRTNTVAAFR